MLDDILQQAIWLQELADYNLKRHSDYETVRSNAGCYMFWIVSLCVQEQIFQSPVGKKMNEFRSIYDGILIGRKNVDGFYIPAKIVDRIDTLQEWKDRRYDPYFVPSEEQINEVFSMVTDYLDRVKEMEG